MSAAAPDPLADRFAALWENPADPPDVIAFLRGHPGAEPRERADVLLIDQYHRAAAGCLVPVEDYLHAFPEVAADPELKLDLVYGEYRAVCRCGPPPDPEALAARFPDVREALLRQLEVAAWRTPSPERSVTAAWGPEALSRRRNPVRPPDEPPAVEGFQFLRMLGDGGFGRVWLARHLALDRLVAVKHLRADRWDDEAVGRLVHEARVMASLKVHRNRVTVFDLVQGPAGCFLVLDYVAGGPLSSQVTVGRPLAWGRAARYVADVAEGLAEVHARGLLHRDVKPANILWDRERDEALLTDFGLAAHSSQDAPSGGTFGYMAPEGFERRPSAKSDVFGLAATLFCLVTGRPPFDARDGLASYRQARAGLARPVAALAHLPASLAEVILAGLEPEPGGRPDLAAFVARLRSAHSQALADRLRETARHTPARVRLCVTLSVGNERDLVFRQVAFASSHEATPGGPDAAALAPLPAVRTGDLLRLEATATAPGYLSVLNLSSSGELHVLFPNPKSPDHRVQEGRPHLLTMKLTPPAGTDCAVVVWTREPIAPGPAEWRRRLESGDFAVPAGEPSRGMELVLHEEQEPAADAWTAVIVALEHQP
jgi:serine/threonine protein kinase